jgi:putative intracellular protease/amidase
MKQTSFFSAILVLLIMAAPTELAGQEQPRPVCALVLLGEWFGDAYFPLKEEIAARGWTMKRVGVDAKYRGCYKKKRDVVLTSDILIPDLKDFSAYDVLIIPSGPQFRKFKENPAVLQFVREAHAAGLLIASFCVGNNIVAAAGLVDIPYGPSLFPEKVTRVKERIFLGPRGGGPPPGDGFQSAPIKEICDAIERELAGGKANTMALPGSDLQIQSRRVALATYADDEEQVRAVRALARSLRERGGPYASSSLYVVTPDPGAKTAGMLKGLGVELLPLEMTGAFMDYPLAIKAFAAAQVERKVKDDARTLIWLDPGVLVLSALADLELDERHDAALRPVTLANTIGIPPQSEPNDYWRPIYAATGLDYSKLVTLETIADQVKIQPYYNCEVYSFNPGIGIATEWARLLTRFLKDDNYQKNVCSTFLRKLFLHQAVLSAVIASKVKPERIRALPLASGYPFSQHARLPEARRASRLEDIAVVIFDRAWAQDGKWLERIPAGEPLKKWLLRVYHDYLRK